MECDMVYSQTPLFSRLTRVSMLPMDFISQSLVQHSDQVSCQLWRRPTPMRNHPTVNHQIQRRTFRTIDRFIYLVFVIHLALCLPLSHGHLILPRGANSSNPKESIVNSTSEQTLTTKSVLEMKTPSWHELDINAVDSFSSRMRSIPLLASSSHHQRHRSLPNNGYGNVRNMKINMVTKALRRLRRSTRDFSHKTFDNSGRNNPTIPMNDVAAHNNPFNTLNAGWSSNPKRSLYEASPLFSSGYPQTNEHQTTHHEAVLNKERLKELIYFVSRILSRSKSYIDPIQAFIALREWELYRNRKQMLRSRDRKSREQRRRGEQARSLEYHRTLRQYARESTREHAKRVSQARTFDEFKQILSMSSPTTEHETNAMNNDVVPLVRRKRPMPSEALVGPRLKYPIPGQLNVIATSSSELQFPGAMGGGLFARGLRPIRAVSSQTMAKKPMKMNASTTMALPNNDTKQHPVLQEDMYEEPHYTEAELLSAFQSYQIFKKTACQPRIRTLCTHCMLGMTGHHTDLTIPRGFHVNRCGTQIPSHWAPSSSVGIVGGGLSDVQTPISLTNNPADHSNMERFSSTVFHQDQPSCLCESPDEECLPTEVKAKTQAVAIIQVHPSKSVKYSTEIILVTEHVACGCLPRCAKRSCVKPLKLNSHTFADCSCACEPNDQRCQELLEGKRSFTVNEIPLPLNGTFILPPCIYGPMDELHLHFRRCPRKT